MFIELTDHLRCPADHDEAFLVLIPVEVADRQVRSGHLGCPVCERSFPIVDGVAVFGGRGPDPTSPTDAEPVDAAGLAALLGLEGPGGYVLLVGDVSGRADALTGVLPGIHFATLNGPGDVVDSMTVSRLIAPSIPLKTRSMRGVILGGDARQPGWQSEAARVVLPGLRVVGQGSMSEGIGLEPLGAAGGWWVGRRR